jgi:D-beta-D-heptose 7-phosphate kinase/D-beta-D-heptose 1-phosphate adenosyltransferase
MNKFFREVVLVTGGFDPIHSGHISYFNRARELSDRLIVGVNSDEWLRRKKGLYFLPWRERAEIILNLRMVDDVITVPDDDKGSACGSIAKCLEIADKVIFCNGGDRKKTNIPEINMYGDNSRVEFKFGIGGDNKINSSSWILQEYFDRQRKLLGV